MDVRDFHSRASGEMEICLLLLPPSLNYALQMPFLQETLAVLRLRATLLPSLGTGWMRSTRARLGSTSLYRRALVNIFARPQDT